MRRSAPTAAFEVRKVSPVKWWAVTGGFFVVLQCWIYGRWIASGPETTARGDTPVPGFMTFTARLHEIVFPILFLVGLYFLVVRPKRRTGSVSTDAYIFIGLMFMYWQDPIPNMLRVGYTYNTVFHQWGSWASFIPGWILPDGHRFGEPLLMMVPIYPVALFSGILFACAVMREAKRRRPYLGPVGLVATAFAAMLVFDFVAEMFWLRTGVYSYVGGIPALTIFYGHYYQLPIYQLPWVVAWTAMAAFRYFKDDRGNTVTERGLDTLKVTDRQRAGVRFLAWVGVLNVLFLFIYNLPFAFGTMLGNGWVPDVSERSYFTNQLCGPGTNHACNTADLPIPQRSSIDIRPDGTLYIPPGTSLPR
jgi:hypothetical protein